MVDEIRILDKALGSSEYVLTEKQKQEHRGSRSLFVVKDIAAGETLTPENIRSIRPGIGLIPCIMKKCSAKGQSIS